MNVLPIDDEIKFIYRNHRGETNVRRVTPEKIVYLTEPGYGYTAGWFLVGYDHDRSANRSFEFASIIPDENDPILIEFDGED